MSYLQIYQEKIYDLLNNAASNKIDLTIREHPQKGNVCRHSKLMWIVLVIEVYYIKLYTCKISQSD